MDEAERIIAGIKDSRLDRKLWAATFAGGINQRIVCIVDSLIELLEQDDIEPIGVLGDIKYELCIGRAVVSLARLFAKLEVANKRRRLLKTRHLVNRLCASSSLEIAHHASYARRLLDSSPEEDSSPDKSEE